MAACLYHCSTNKLYHVLVSLYDSRLIIIENWWFGEVSLAHVQAKQNSLGSEAKMSLHLGS